MADLLRTKKVDCRRRGEDRRAREESGKLSMNANKNPSPEGKSPSEQIDAIIRESGDWRGKKLAQLRAVIKHADPTVVEAVKWKKPSRPEGVPFGLMMAHSA